MVKILTIVLSSHSFPNFMKPGSAETFASLPIPVRRIDSIDLNPISKGTASLSTITKVWLCELAILKPEPG